MPNNFYYSKTLEKGLRILELFNKENAHLSLSDISKAVGINKTSAFRYINTLDKMGYLDKRQNTKLNRLGYSSLILGHNIMQAFHLLNIVKPLIDHTYSEHVITIDSALYYDFSLLALYRREAPNTIFFRQPTVGKELHARALGKAVLAELSKAEINNFLESTPLNRFTQNTITNVEQLKVEIEQTKKRGYSLNNEEFMHGLICIGAPLKHFKTQEVLGAISFDFPSTEIDLSILETRYGRLISNLANDLSEMIVTAEP